MNQHDEQQAYQPGEASTAGTGTTTGDGRVDETPSVPPAPQVETAGQSAIEATGEGPPDVSDQAAAGDDATGVTGPSAVAAPSTGDDRVDEALSRLGELDRLDVTEHAGVVQDVHRALQDTLAEEED